MAKVKKCDNEKLRVMEMGKVKEFQSYLQREERAAATISKYLHDLRIFSEFMDGSLVTKDGVIKYKEKLIKSYHARSVNSMLAAINCFFEFIGWNDCKVKLIKIQRQMFCEEQKELQKSEYFRLVKAAKKQGKERLAMMLQTLCSLGLRVSELKFVTVDSVQAGRLQIFNKGKNRSVFIGGKLKKQLIRYIRKQNIQDGEIFITRTGKTVDRSNIWREMKNLHKEAQVVYKKIFPHNLRHLFARTYYSMKKDVVKLADIMGHSNIETTRIYTISSGREYGQLLEALNLVL